MLKVDKGLKKRWLLFVLLNMLILLVVLGALMTGFGVVMANENKRALESDIANYAAELKQYSLKELTDICDGKTHDIENPSFSFGIYVIRGDNSFEFKSSDGFLANNNPSIGGKLDSVTEESLAKHSFLTYTTSVKDSPGAYIKVFAPVDFMVTSSKSIALYGVLFGIGFVVLCIIISIVLGYLEIKPIVENYLKQKNFINDMSHEIRTPLAIIKGNLENALVNPGVSVNSVREDIEECIDEVNYMTNMSAGLLDIVHIENKKSKKDTILSEAVAEAVDVFADVAAMSNKSLLARIDYCPAVVDKEKIKQLVSILIDNALKYTSDGDRINIKLKNNGDLCVLTVQDTGIGVKKEELEHIFERFYRGENTKSIEGSGLGLSIAKSIVESGGGTIKANQNVPNGLEITVVFKAG